MSLKLLFEGQAVKSEMVVLILEKRDCTRRWKNSRQIPPSTTWTAIPACWSPKKNTSAATKSSGRKRDRAGRVLRCWDKPRLKKGRWQPSGLCGLRAIRRIAPAISLRADILRRETFRSCQMMRGRFCEGSTVGTAESNACV